MAMMMFARHLTAEAKRLDRPTKLCANEAKHRIAAVDRQKALVEEMSNAACMAATGLKVDAPIEKIKAKKAIPEKVHNELRVGDPEIGLSGEEHYSRVVKALAKVDGEWRTYLNALAQIIEEGELSDANATVILDDEVVLLAVLEDLLTAVKTA